MGGHGGLNILPQKKWNVYNWDNRAIVQKDKKQAAEKKRKAQEQERMRILKNKVELLKDQNGIQKQQSSLITQELKKIQHDHKHINFFEKEQRIIQNQELVEAKILAQRQFLKDKDFDISSKFMGAYNDEKMKPWYLKKNQNKQKAAKEKYVNPLLAVKTTSSEITKEVYIKQNQRQRSRDNLKLQHLKTKESSLSNIEKLKRQRREREEKERKRANQLIRQKLMK